MNIIQINNLLIRYSNEKAVISNMSIDFHEGKMIALIGENGVGKSTLLKCIAGLIPFQSGSVYIEGKTIDQISASDFAKKVAVVLTEPVNNGMLTVSDFISYGRYPYISWLGRLQTKDYELIEKAIERCNLSSLKDKKLVELSDGQRQKVMIARAIAQDTSILILDEPTTHLDYKNTNFIFKMLQDLSREERKTILFSTHQIERALRFADYMVIQKENAISSYETQEFIANNVLMDEFKS
ncbi:MAG: ABC transporter ATP-binding protein [Bacteroidetes bacterium]|nr:MAG: ABC transporter ATP-binding protein [Bacteroidota bacterium]MBL1145422.1 ABC transporter ATP-binding protein [Bacteroidota bacterium]MCB0803485.1 ABC transporter ATP-binding protein [Flavobacteriales bacterium]NOG58220.1 ABC transporter ATP-binding protein [Bacteroidota bacterium]